MYNSGGGGGGGYGDMGGGGGGYGGKQKQNDIAYSVAEDEGSYYYGDSEQSGKFLRCAS